MEILDLRLIRAQDLAPLLEEERGVWQEALRWDYAATASMVLRFMDSHALTGYAAMEAGRAIGYSFYVYENFKGLIGDLFVSSEFRSSSAEGQLVTHVLETLQAMPGIRRIEAQMVNQGGSAVREQFVSQGFQIYDRQFLSLSLADWSAPAALGAAPLPVEPWDAHCFQSAAELIVAAYRGHVDSMISDQYRNQAGAARFLENIIRFPGCGNFLPEVSLLAFRENAEESPAVSQPSPTLRRLAAPPGPPLKAQLDAMILTSIVSDRVAHITQLCVSPQQQRRGLGRRLILEALTRLRQRGFQGVTLTATVANAPALALYRALGFSPLNTFPAFAWEAAAPPRRLTTQRAAARQ